MLNTDLEAADHKPVNPRRIAAALRADEIDAEMVDILNTVEAAVR